MSILLIIGTFIAMEAVAWLTHKYIMHGVFWFLHRDHHQKNPTSFFERNDFFFLIFAIPGIICLALGSFYGNFVALWVGVGITLYGAAYFLIHDVFIHQRFKMFRNTDNSYFLFAWSHTHWDADWSTSATHQRRRFDSYPLGD
ncbi:MAG: sterol desaturase family protein [Bacteroidia bacterium]